MKRARVTPEAACEWLKEHLEALDQFRNASTRDPRFKQWRQSTLTAIQRIWPGVTARSSRFRRIPFSPPSTLADQRQTREAFERGCAEATILVRGWMAEIESSGILLESPDVQDAAGEIAFGAPALTLDREVPLVDSGEKPAKPGKPVTTRTRSSNATPRAGRLKDMLGLAHLSAAAGGPDESKRLESLAEPLPVTPPPSPAGATEPLIIETVTPAAPPPLEFVWPSGSPEASPQSMERLDVADLELTVVEEQPALAPVDRIGDPAGASEIARLAEEVAVYDVPVPERDRVRSTLLDLARSIERGDPSWEALRAATAVVMHYPKLGRRAMPLLLPLLDQTG